MQPSDTPAAAVHPAAPADLPAVGRLGALLVRAHHDFDPERFIAATPQTERAYASFLGGQLAEPDVVVLVVESGGQVLGYTSILAAQFKFSVTLQTTSRGFGLIFLRSREGSAKESELNPSPSLLAAIM
ncbi:MAG: hypothetical protein LC803_11280 [Acidobacteria bacterium]|nr:hypothetical protein [Acidobacteriota bacterium]